jgi:HSP20 family protein
MNLVLRDPFFREFNAFSSASVAAPRASVGSALPRITSYANDDGYVLEAEVPGLASEDVNVTVDDGVVTLIAAPVEDSSEDGGSARRFASGFKRSFRLPSDVDAEAIQASLEHGVLALRFPKTPESTPRQIPVN